ncbi:uncharacterized protein [Miscanthus floridulus]|uniref:uncharacterized protein n=1 Tax=Miscanthus floridulus TaxID=154761 RepID=UPI0034587DF9
MARSGRGMPGAPRDESGSTGAGGTPALDGGKAGRGRRWRPTVEGGAGGGAGRGAGRGGEGRRDQGARGDATKGRGAASRRARGRSGVARRGRGRWWRGAGEGGGGGGAARHGAGEGGRGGGAARLGYPRAREGEEERKGVGPIVSLAGYAKLGLWGVETLDIIYCCIMMVSFLPALSIKIAVSW